MKNSRTHDAFSSRATRIGLLILVPIAIAVGARAISWATPKVWSHGDTLTAEDLNANFKELADSIARGSPWVACGKFEDLRNDRVRCELDGYSVDEFEYGVKFVGPEVKAIDCQSWNVGLRIVNKSPYMIFADNPPDGTMQLGGAMWYTETNSLDDDIPSMCASGTWRHRYWQIVNGSVQLHSFSNGCSNLEIFCRRR